VLRPHLVAALWVSCALAGAAFAEAPPFEHCREDVEVAAGGTATLLVEAISRNGERSESRAQLTWQRQESTSRVLLEMLEPPELSGSRVLLVSSEGEKPEAWAYLPEIAKVKRVGERHLRKPLFGTTITYADLERAGLLAEDAEVVEWTSGDLDGRPIWKIESRAGRERVTSWLDRERCIPLRTEVVDRKGRLARLLELSSERFPAAEAYVPRELLVRDVLDREETRIVVEEFVPAEIAIRFFDPKRLAGAAHASTLR
jgi:hypothetical protein